MLGSDPLGGPNEPVGRWRPWAWADFRRVRNHLADHCEIQQGHISKTWSESFELSPADGGPKSTSTVTYVTVVYPSSTGQYETTEKRDGLHVGQSVLVHCCPYYPDKLFLIEWTDRDRYVCPRHRPPMSIWRRLDEWMS